MQVPFLDLQRQHQAITRELTDSFTQIITTCSFIGGEAVKKFEKGMADYLGVNHAIGCGNGTEALILALRACNVRPGDEVITTPFTFFATAEAIASIGAVPVFVDVRLDDYQIDPEQIEAKITAKTKAILPVHIFGAACNMQRILEIARAHNLKVIEDAAQGVGCTYQGKKVGTLGHVGCFSFYPTKNLGGIGDGGMVTTQDDEIGTTLLALREHGAGKNGAKARAYLEGITEVVETNEQTTALYDPYKYYNYLIGYNSRLDAIQAAALSIKLGKLDQYNQARASIAERYNNSLTDQVCRPIYPSDTTPCWHQYVIRTTKKKELCQYLQENGVGCGTFYPVPLHLQKAFSALGYHTGSLPSAERLSEETVCLPIFPELNDDEVSYVIEIVNKFFEG